jgi:diguanylate cyclase (GGDEF)-like protein
MSKLTLTDILTPTIDCTHPDSSIKSIFKTLTDNNYSCCIIAGSNRIPLGIITERDLVQLISTANNPETIMNDSVIDHMSSTPFTMPGDTTLKVALDSIEHRNLRHILVTEADGTISGIVTQTNLVQAYSQIIQNHTNELEETVVKRTEQLEKINQKLTTLSLVDPLTDLGNRRAMEVDLMKVHASGIRHRRAYSVILFDIDFFKKYNDHYGHQAGDKALQMVAIHFRESIRESDSIYRYGGEEFLMIMPDTNNEEALIPVSRIIDNLFGCQIPHSHSPLDYLSTSAGIASSLHQGQRLASWRQVVELADEGLYEAKTSGRNQVIVSKKSTLKVVKKA